MSELIDDRGWLKGELPVWEYGSVGVWELLIQDAARLIEDRG